MSNNAIEDTNQQGASFAIAFGQLPPDFDTFNENEAKNDLVAAVELCKFCSYLRLLSN